MIQRLENPQAAVSLFDGRHNGILLSCLQGIMGAVYGDGECEDAPASAMAVLGDFCFLSGQPSESLLRYRDEKLPREYAILIPGDEEWEKLLEGYFGKRARRFARYAMKAEMKDFDRNRLRMLSGKLPDGFELRRMDEKLYELCKREEWSLDLVSQFPDYETYSRLAVGVAAVKTKCPDEGDSCKEIPVSGASAYAGYRDGIEIEIDTKAEYRRMGLASACGAGLILVCLERGIYPGWDAHNLESVDLAEKLGYHLDFVYTAYEVAGTTESGGHRQ